MHENTLFPLASLFILGLGSQWLAWKMKLPAIVTLIGAGLLAGPVSGFLKPDQLLGDFLQPMVSLSVAVILFEGGLGLKFDDLKECETLRSVRRLVLFGALITWTLLTLFAMQLLGFPFELALLLAAILVVTGPTVILPLIRQVGLSGRVPTVLKWEGMMNDPLGAVLAVVVFEAIRGGELSNFETIALSGILKTIVLSLLSASLVGAFFTFSLRRFWIPDHLQAPLALAAALFVYGTCDLVQPESGLAAVTLLGLFISHSKDVSLRHIHGFKENLSVLLISTLFIVLSARLTWENLVGIKMSWVLFVLSAVFLVRPLAVVVSTFGSGLNWKEKLYLSAIGPRGIVAAAVSSVFALELRGSGYEGAENLMIITFLVIAGSVLVSGLIATPLARALKLAQKGKGTLLMVGAHDRARCLASALTEGGVPVLLVDTNRGNVAAAQEEGLEAIQGDILSKEVERKLDFSEIGALLSVLRNDEVNTLAVIKYRHELGRANVFRILSKRGDNPEAGRPFGGLTRQELDETWDAGHRPAVVEVDEGCNPQRPLVMLRGDGDWDVIDGEKELSPGDRVVALAPGRVSPATTN